MKKRILLKPGHVMGCFLVVCLLSAQSYAQTQINGTVSEAGGAGLVGVNVVVKGTSTGTITDSQGAYSITASPSDVLVFSFVGYLTQEISVGNRTTIDLQLEADITTLQEIVVTGYAGEKKADLMGAVAVVDMKPLINNATGNPMQGLQGRVAGLYIEKNGGSPNGENSRILIRGSNTLGNTDPLYVIDGVPTKRPEVFQSLPASSIESVQILKDASAASIYGSRASNGVIIVTTKDGAGKGENLSITINHSSSLLTTKPQRVEMLNAEERGRILWEGAVNDRTNPNANTNIYSYDWNENYDNPVLNKVNITPFLGGDPTVPAGDTDWQDASYETATLSSTDISVAAGSANSSLLVNFGYVKNTGTFVYTGYERFSTRINANTRFYKNRLKIGINAEVSSSNETLASNDLGNSPNPAQAITLAPTIPVYTTTGEFAGPLGAGYTDRNNPVGMQYRNRWDDLGKSLIFGNIYVEAELVKNLIFKSSLGYDYSTALNKNIELAFQEGFLGRQVNSLLKSTTNQLTLTWSNTLRYQLQMGKSTFNFLAGVEAIRNDRDFFSSYRETFANQSEDFFYIDAGSGRSVTSGTATGNRLLSQFGKINYSFDDKYLASVTVRRDGSSRFGEDNRYGVFPAVTLGWRIANESFMQDLEWISDLKLRAGYGRVGNQDIGNQDNQNIADVASLGLYYPNYGTLFNNGVGFPGQWLNVGTAYDLAGANGGTLPSGFVSVQAGNSALKWEQTQEVNIGLDFSFINDKIFGSFDYFTRKTTDILVQPPVAAAVGEGKIRWVNGATKENNGFELVLGFRNQSGPLTYSINGNLSRFRDIITELPDEVRSAYPGNAEKSIVGHSQLSLFGYRSDGLFQSQEEVDAHATQVGKGIGRIRYKDLNADGKIDALDQDWLGTILPAFEYGIRIDIAYSNFDLSIFGSGISGRTGTDPYGTLSNRIDVRNNNANNGILNAWSPTNTSSKVPRLSLVDANSENRASDFFIVNTSYFKMRTIQLGYTLPSSLSQRARIQSLRLFVMGDNLFWFRSKELTADDPELISINLIPVPTSYTVGLNVTF
jgi:TonB-dependent starch-binding outer membrane protein SusC